ncbi:adenylate cyclase [Skermanella aerolata]|uniref:adenylate/guanylate cyclase domain-containing protein n=1 Tax=Skermanella aerolata TaxID=393310 RepID=UPI003D1AD6D3
MRLRIRSTLLVAIVALMACSLSVVSAVVLHRHGAVVRAVADREIEQVAADVAQRVSRFLESGPVVLNRVKYLVEHQDHALTAADFMTDYLVSEVRAEAALTWVSVSAAETGEFLGVTRRDGRIVLNRSHPARGNGLASEWELRPNGAWTPLTTGPGIPYDPRDKAWFVQGIDADKPGWTAPYEFAEGRPGISAVVGLRTPETGRAIGVATADFHLREIESFLDGLSVGHGGRALILAPGSGGEPLFLGASSAFPDDLRGALTTASRRPAAHSDESFRQTVGGVIVDCRPLSLSAGLRWQLIVMLPLADVEAPMRAATTAVLVTAGIFLAIGIVAAIAVAHAISRPIRQMNGDLAKIGDLQFSCAGPAGSCIREIDAMARSLNRMKAALRSFSLYVPIDVVRSVLASGQAAEPGGELRVLTVLISDVAGFTRVAENMPPEKLVHHLSRYFGILERAVHDSRGVVDKFMGDGMLAFFNAPSRADNHAAQACHAALDAQRSLKHLDLEAEDAPTFRTRIGLAMGEVLVGNIGTAHRLSYTAIGDAVNLASRLEMLNKAYGTAILASGEVRWTAGDGFEWRHLDRITVPGRLEPLELYELLGRAGEVDAIKIAVRNLHESGLQHLLSSRYDDAERAFHAILDRVPHDKPAEYLLEHTRSMRTRSADMLPSQIWWGVHIHDAKI